MAGLAALTLCLMSVTKADTNPESCVVKTRKSASMPRSLESATTCCLIIDNE